MANLKEIRGRIGSVRNTQKITTAMKLVAASKLKRAQDAASASRPYARKMRDVVASLAAGIESDAHPLFRTVETPSAVLLIVLTSDRGLCGGFNANVLKKAEGALREFKRTDTQVELAMIGTKGHGYFRRRSVPMRDDVTHGAKTPTSGSAALIAERAMEMFTAEKVDEVYVIFNEFKSALTQNTVMEQILPLTAEMFAATDGAGEASKEDSDAALEEWIYEPGRDALLAGLLPRYVESQVFRAMLESQASEQGARMTAMDSASNNAKDLITKLTLTYNRVRQASITTELMEITSGAEALKG
jgi:F-type H+-transporting ATPase subunit gamma